MKDGQHNQTAGKLGEDMAVGLLWQLGYAIIARRYRTRFGEIDIIARDGQTMVFVEVKARRTSRCGTAAEVLPDDERQQREQGDAGEGPREQLRRAAAPAARSARRRHRSSGAIGRGPAAVAEPRGRREAGATTRAESLVGHRPQS